MPAPSALSALTCTLFPQHFTRRLPAMVKLDLLIAKLDYYIVKTPNLFPFEFSIGGEGIFLFIKPVQFALLWPWVKL